MNVSDTVELVLKKSYTKILSEHEIMSKIEKKSKNVFPPPGINLIFNMVR